jgi:hypothetical protein
MLINRLSFEEQGRHYGYPECCISNYSNKNNNKKIEIFFYYLNKFITTKQYNKTNATISFYLFTSNYLYG